MSSLIIHSSVSQMKKILFITILTLLLAPSVFCHAAQIGNLEKGLVGHWALDNITKARDLSPYGNNGTGAGGITIGGATDQHGQANKATTFTAASSQYVDVGAGSKFNFERTNPFSIGFWAKTSTAAIQRPVSKFDTSGNYFRGYGIQLASTITQFQIVNTWSTNVLDVYTSDSITNGNWHYVAVTYDGSSTAAGAKIYIDGTSRSLATAHDTLSATIQNSISLQMGGSSPTNRQYFNGSLSDVRIYNRALSSAEVTQLYNSYRPQVQVSKNLVTNGSFTSSTTGWTASSASLASVAGGQSGNALQITNTTANSGYAYQTFSGVAGQIYQISFGEKKGTGASGWISVGTLPGAYDIVGNQGSFGNTNWNLRTFTFKAPTTRSYYLNLWVNTIVQNDTYLFDEITVTAPKISTGSLQKGLVGWWKLDNITGARDKSAYGNNGTGAGGITIGGATDQHGQAGKATTFNGTSQYITTASSPVTSTNSAFSVSTWVNATTFLSISGANRRILSDDINANTAFQLTLNTATLGYQNVFTFVVYKNGTEYTKFTTPVWNTNTWYHVVAVWDGNAHVIYVNGVSQALTSDSGLSKGTADSKLHIGSRNGSPNTGFFSGSLADVRIYNRALSAAEVLLLYQGYGN
ncbi:MAG: LamG domain-containing protein [Candidatus Staskawiczbacteria bacterium]|nr:LamG domain-containing protein [Candidatus Staskawiczbacteria bacterium]